MPKLLTDIPISEIPRRFKFSKIKRAAIQRGYELGLSGKNVDWRRVMVLRGPGAVGACAAGAWRWGFMKGREEIEIPIASKMPDLQLPWKLW